MYWLNADIFKEPQEGVVEAFPLGFCLKTHILVIVFSEHQTVFLSLLSWHIIVTLMVLWRHQRLLLWNRITPLRITAQGHFTSFTHRDLAEVTSKWTELPKYQITCIYSPFFRLFEVCALLWSFFHYLHGCCLKSANWWEMIRKSEWLASGWTTDLLPPSL